MANGDYGGVGGRTRGCFCAGSPRHEYRGGKTARANARAGIFEDKERTLRGTRLYLAATSRHYIEVAVEAVRTRPFVIQYVHDEMKQAVLNAAPTPHAHSSSASRSRRRTRSYPSLLLSFSPQLPSFGFRSIAASRCAAP